MQELMDPQAMLDAVTFIHQTNATSSGTRWAIWMTGVGAGLAQKLFSQSGASATLYDFQVPYSNEIRRQMVRNEGYAPSQKAVSREAAVELAQAAHSRLVCAVTEPGNPFWGMGITGALQTGRDRRGGDVVYFAITNGADIWTVQIAFQRKDEDGNGWTREQQQLIVDVVGLQLITWALKQRLAGRQPLLWRLKQEAEHSLCLNESLFPARLYSPERRPGVKTDDGRTSLPTLKQFCFEPTPLRSLPLDLTKVLSSGIPTLLTEQGEAVPADVARLQQSSSGKLCLIPTSSRPLHEGHLWMAYIARELGMNPCFAITRSHAGGKPSVSNTELEQRAADFLGRSNVLFLQGPYLVSMMSELQINEASDPVCFLLGMDVAEKLLDHSLPTCLRDLEELRRNRVTIYVLVRAGVQKRLADLLAGPVQEYASMFRELDLNGPEVSSTEIRSILGMDERRG